MTNIFQSNSESPTMKFNGNSKEFSLNWNFQENAFKGARSPKEEFKPLGPATRTDRFIEKKPINTPTKIGERGTEPPVTLAQSPKITRNDREKTTWYFGDKAPDTKKVEKVERTDKELQKLGKEFEELKTQEKRQKKEEVNRMNDEKIQKLNKKMKEREPFRL